jgi:hypothetical protein
MDKPHIMLITINHVNPAYPNAVTTLQPWSIDPRETTFYIYSADTAAIIVLLKYILARQVNAMIYLKTSLSSDTMYHLRIDQEGLNALLHGTRIDHGLLHGECLSDLLVRHSLSLQSPLTHMDIPNDDYYYVITENEITTQTRAEVIKNKLEAEITHCLDVKRQKLTSLAEELARAELLRRYADALLSRQLHVTSNKKTIQSILQCDEATVDWIWEQPIKNLVDNHAQVRCEAIESEIHVLRRKTGQELMIEYR